METVSFRHTTTHGMVRQIPKPCQIHGGGGDQLRMPSGFRSSKMKAKQSSVGAAAVVKCAAWETGFLKDLGRELEQGGEDWKTLEKCKEEKGMVEVLECLEREAILGDDDGRDPRDYKRRAHIFDHSSRVFQALKQHNQPTHSPKP